MMRRLFLLIGLGLSAIGPALPDIINNVTVNGSVTGSGAVSTICQQGAPECLPVIGGTNLASFTFSFSAVNSQLGEFSASGGVSSTGPPETDTASIDASESQNTTATAGALDITLGMTDATSGAVFGFSVDLLDSVAVGFYLTEESEIQLTGNLFFGFDPPLSVNTGELLDSKDNVILVVPSFGGNFSASAVLQPGMYILNDSVENGAAGGESGLDQLFEADLNASFTPIPEPRWIIIATLLAALLGRYVASHRHAARMAKRP